MEENPCINDLDISQRRTWEKYLRRRAKGVAGDRDEPPTRECSYCGAQNPLIELECLICYKAYEKPEKRRIPSTTFASPMQFAEV